MDYAIDSKFYRISNEMTRQSYSDIVRRVRTKEKLTQADAELSLHEDITRMIKRHSRWAHSLIIDLIDKATVEVQRDIGATRIERLIAMQEATSNLSKGRIPELGLREPPHG